MIKWRDLIRRVKELTGIGREDFDPASLDDPVALKTEWTSAKSGGRNFRSHRLVDIDQNRLEFKSSVIAIGFYLFLLVMGWGVVVGYSYSALSADQAHKSLTEILPPIAIGLVFILAGGYLFYLGTAPIVFDLHHGWYWKGRLSPENVFDKRT